MKNIKVVLNEVRQMNENKDYNGVLAIVNDADLEKYNNDLLYGEISKSYSRLGKNEKSNRYADLALAISKTSSMALHYKGNYFWKTKDFDSARKYFEKSIKSNPEYSCPYNGLGNLYYSMNQYEKAKKYYLKAIEIDTNNTKYHYNLAWIFQNENNYQKALIHYKLCVQLTLDKSDFFAKIASERILELEKILTENKEFTKIRESIESIVDKIRAALLFKGDCITHYTQPLVTQKLIISQESEFKNESPFQLSEGSFLNDTSEGKELFDFLDFHEETKQGRNTEAILFIEKPFIGSFVAADKHDDLGLWRMYGKAEQEEAKGYSITLNAKKFRDAILNHLNIKDSKNMNSTDEEEFNFYNVSYVDRKYMESKTTFKFKIPNNQDAESILNEQITKLKQAIENFKKYSSKSPKTAREEKITILEKLNQIAYLFKSIEYSYEHELRMVTRGIGFTKFMDKLPRVYIELAPIRNSINKITLGPKAENKEEWAAAFHYNLEQDGINDVEILISRLPFK